jgi:hypothetical protein
MYINQDAIDARNKRLADRAAKFKAVQRMQSVRQVASGIRSELNQLGFDHVRGLFGRLCKGKTLTATQFYNIT